MRPIAEPKLIRWNIPEATIQMERTLILCCLRGAIPIYKWRHHGLGLLQAYIDPRTRIHVWAKELTRGIVVDNGARHDHRFDVESHIHFGAIINHGLDVSASGTGEWSAWNVVNASENDPRPPEMEDPGLDIINDEVLRIDPGEAYTFPKWAFHWSEPVYDEGVVVTLVTRHNVENAPAHILSKEAPAHGFTEGHLPSSKIAMAILDRAYFAMGGGR